jgi:hypothetical protein
VRAFRRLFAGTGGGSATLAATFSQAEPSGAAKCRRRPPCARGACGEQTRVCGQSSGTRRPASPTRAGHRVARASGLGGVAIRRTRPRPGRDGGAGRRFPLVQRARIAQCAETAYYRSEFSWLCCFGRSRTTFWPVSRPSQALHRGGHGCGGANPRAHADGPPVRHTAVCRPTGEPAGPRTQSQETGPQAECPAKGLTLLPGPAIVRRKVGSYLLQYKVLSRPGICRRMGVSSVSSGPGAELSVSAPNSY